VFHTHPQHRAVFTLFSCDSAGLRNELGCSSGRDHADGNEELVAQLKDAQSKAADAKVKPVLVVGADKRIPALTREFDDQEELAIGSIRIRVLKTPGHTLGHVLYYATDTASPDLPGALFTGDTLFIGLCV
jgi:glyoxylase-like metal-dependent hydrolase (beta-lactamase superfamily II)